MEIQLKTIQEFADEKGITHQWVHANIWRWSQDVLTIPERESGAKWKHPTRFILPDEYIIVNKKLVDTLFHGTKAKVKLR